MALSDRSLNFFFDSGTVGPPGPFAKARALMLELTELTSLDVVIRAR